MHLCQITVQVDLPTGAGVVRAKVVLLVPVVIPFPPFLHGSHEVKFFAGMESLLDIFNPLCYSKNGKDTFHSKKRRSPLKKSFELRKERGIRQGWLRRSAVSRQTIGSLEDGRYNPSSCWPSRSPGISAGPLKKFLSQRRGGRIAKPRTHDLLKIVLGILLAVGGVVLLGIPA